MRGSKKPVLFLTAVLLVLMTGAGAMATELKQSMFDQELTRIRYGINSSQDRADLELASVDEEDLPLSVIAAADATPLNYKSPGKAFLYSLLVPGLGQLYYGSRMKPVAFVALEAFGWSQALKFHSNGADLTDAYEAFAGEHWIHDRYSESGSLHRLRAVR